MLLRMTLSELQGHSFIGNLVKCDFSYSYAAVLKISADKVHQAFPLRYCCVVCI